MTKPAAQAKSGNSGAGDCITKEKALKVQAKGI